MKITLFGLDIEWKSRHRLKSINELNSEKIEQLKLQCIRTALHTAVDAGLLDDKIHDIGRETKPEE